MPDTVKVALEPSRTEAVVQRDQDGKVVGLRTVTE